MSPESTSALRSGGRGRWGWEKEADEVLGTPHTGCLVVLAHDFPLPTLLKARDSAQS